MNNLHLLDFPTILKKFTNRYMAIHGHEDPYEINCGECFVWAWGVYNFLKKQGIPVDLVTCVSHGGHAWIQIDGEAYDSEHLNGVDTWELITDFIGESFMDPEYFIQEEQDFYDHWRESGRRGDMLVNKYVQSKMNRSLSQLARFNQKVA